METSRPDTVEAGTPTAEIFTSPAPAVTIIEAAGSSIASKFGASPEHMDHSGFDEWRRIDWQQQLHLFHIPFYYVEYGIAQLGALQLWMKSKDDPRKAVANYRAALALGGTRPLPELFSAAGIAFDFSEKTLQPLMNALGEELARLPS